MSLSSTKRCIRHFLAAFWLAVGGGLAGAAPVISLSPATTSIGIGNSFSVSVLGTGLTDLYAWQFGLTFDAAVVHLTSVLEGDALSNVGTTFFVEGTVDNAVGELLLAGNTLLGDVPGFNGDGVLATLSFGAVGAGNSSLSLTDVVLLDSSFGITTPSFNNATVEVRPIPEPHAVLLMVVGLMVLALAQGRRLPPSPLRSA